LMTLTEGIFPDTANVNAAGHLAVGGSDLVELAGRYGTPLYVYDEATIRARARAFRTALAGYPARTTVCYAAKAYCAPWILRLAAEEGLGLDVVSSGELHTAALAGFASERISFHGNNKTEDELEMALRLRVGRVVIDNLEEIGRLADRATAAGVRQAVLLRVSPGVTAHTHTHLQTGAADTKFGFGPDVVGADGRRVVAPAWLRPAPRPRDRARPRARGDLGYRPVSRRLSKGAPARPHIRRRRRRHGGQHPTDRLRCGIHRRARQSHAGPRRGHVRDRGALLRIG